VAKASPPIAAETVRLDMYRMMQEARLFEKRAQDLFLEGLVKGTSHLALGQEAVAAGFAAALRPEDLDAVLEELRDLLDRALALSKEAEGLDDQEGLERVTFFYTMHRQPGAS
jgi:TPP-dependent pyruvate/acetoin dehydrogenase alpha subunit